MAEVFSGPCPACGLRARHLVVEGGEVGVAECALACGFVWYQKRRI